MMDVHRTLRTAVNTGRVVMGIRETRKAHARGDLKMVVLAKNCPSSVAEEIARWDIPVYRFGGTNLALGSVCGKPFSISVLGIVSPGKSEVMKLVQVSS